MIRPAMSISICAKRAQFLLAASVCLSASYPVAAQMQQEPDVKDVAMTPLEDIGLMGKDIPEPLLIAARNPYQSGGLSTCNSIVAEIATLDTILGEDYDITEGQKTGLSIGKAAKSVVGSFIPFRGVVREVSGAAGDQRKAQAAVMAGMVRRGYLKGLGEARGCDYPARPKEQVEVVLTGE